MTYDLVSIGRVNMDLFSRDVGAEFRDIRSFDAMVGGSPANIAISSARLGLNTALLTAVGKDKVGSFVLGFLEDEGVETAYVATKPQKTSLALLGVQPPDRFPLEFYREDPADIHLTPKEVEAFPWDDAKAFQLSGNALSRGVGADAAVRATELAAQHGLERYVDLDLRPVEWQEPSAFGEAVRSVLGLLTVVIGTEEEVWAALSSEPELVMGESKLASDRHDALLTLGTRALERNPQLKAIIIKRGPAGATVLTNNEEAVDVAGFPITVVNTVGAGDAFAGGLIAGRTWAWDWRKAIRFANACGAIEVTRHGCSVAFPRLEEVERFIADNGGW